MKTCSSGHSGTLTIAQKNGVSVQALPRYDYDRSILGSASNMGDTTKPQAAIETPANQSLGKVRPSRPSASRNNLKAAQAFPYRGDDAVNDRAAESDVLARLRAENARLIALLEAHGIEWQSPPEPSPPTSAQDISWKGNPTAYTLSIPAYPAPSQSLAERRVGEMGCSLRLSGWRDEPGHRRLDFLL
jgi:hypothetical protein